MSGDGITVDLEGSALDPQAVSAAIDKVEKLVKSVASDGEVRLVLTGLRGGSAHISMSASGLSVDALHDGIEELRRGPALPVGWTRDSLLAVVGLNRVSELRGVESIGLRLGEAISAIDGVIRENAELALEPSSISLGSVRGTIYRYSNDTTRNRRSAGLRRADNGEAIELRFSAEDAALVRQHLETDIEVWGEIARDITGQVAYLTVEGIETVVGNDVPADGGRGLLGSDWTGGVDPAEWVRMMRG